MTWATRVLEDALTSSIGGGRVTHAVFATHDFDPAFFQDQILPTLLPDDLSRHRLRRALQVHHHLANEGLKVDVLYEHGALVADGPAVGRLNWNSFPVHLTTGVFHPKLVLCLCEDEAGTYLVVMTSSANLRTSSWRTNVESGHVEVLRAGQQHGLVSGLRELLIELRTRGEGAASKEIRTFVERELSPYTNWRVNGRVLPALYPGLVVRQRPEPRESLPEFLASRLGNQRWDLKLEVVSPFLDKGDATVLQEFMDWLGVVEARIVLPRVAGKISVTPEVFKAVGETSRASWAAFRDRTIMATGQGLEAGERRLHAKAYRLFRGGSDPVEFTFVGSPNLTTPGHSGRNNWEIGILEQSEKPNTQWALDRIAPDPMPSEFEPLEPEDAEKLGVPLDVQFDWATMDATLRWWGKSAADVTLEGAGLTMGLASVQVAKGWQTVPGELSQALSARLVVASLLMASVGERRGPVLVAEVNMDQKPFALDGIQLTAAQILAMWAMDEEGIRRFLGRAKVKSLPGEPADEFDLPDTVTSMFERFAGIYHGFSIPSAQSRRRCRRRAQGSCFGVAVRPLLRSARELAESSGRRR